MAPHDCQLPHGDPGLCGYMGMCCMCTPACEDHDVPSTPLVMNPTMISS